MAQAIGIGGFFFRARDPGALATWYAERLGVAGDASGAPWQQAAGDTVFAPFSEHTDYFPEDRGFMLNFRVDNLEALIEELQRSGVEVQRNDEWDGPHGQFARIHDPEGNPVELWQPPD
ncbi:MAG: VOC family protein [Pseudomonadota bacterium]